MKLKAKKTHRGFTFFEFTDCYGSKCSLQESSSADEPRIWLGAEELGIKGFYPYTNEPWREIPDNEIKEKFQCESIIGANRMHLNRKQVKALLPHLIKFVETGEV